VHPIGPRTRDGFPTGPDTDWKRLLTQAREITYLGNTFTYPEDSLIGRFLEAGRGWDAVLGTVVSALLDKQDPLVVEVGSNIGASLLQVFAVRPRARAVCFEPSSRFRPYLLENLRSAGVIGRVRVYPWAAGDAPGVVTLYSNASTAASAGRDYAGYETILEEPVRVEKLDEEIYPEWTDFIKVDVDGAEFDVLRGAERLLRSHRPVLHFEFATYLMRDPAGGLSWLRSIGYERFLCLSATGKRIGVTASPEEAVRWAEADESRYCDILTCAEGTTPARRLERLLL
jgi:FkbM family methyltransferase